MKWTCEGSVRGSCGIQHRSYEAAQKCCERDQTKVRSAYPSQFPTRAYSDRAPVPVDDEAKQQADEMACS